MSKDTWKIGILFSRSGITEVTETEHFFGTALAIEEINAGGGVLGRMIEPIAYDPGGDNAAYRALARRLLADDEISIIFGCSMSRSRKAVLPVVERHNGLLFYPSMYEGFEYSENVVYTGATLNQNTFALAEFILRHYGKRVFLVGADYIYPRESNRVMRDIIESKGGEVIDEVYLPPEAGKDRLDPVISDIVRLRPDAVFSTVIGRSAQEFYRLYADAEIDRATCPIASLTMAESEIEVIGADKCTGHILAASYFQTLDSEDNRRFVEAYQKRFGAATRTSIWSEPAYTQVHLFARALQRAGSLDAHRISREILSEDFSAPEGKVSVDSETRHVWVTPRIGIVRDDGLFDIVWEGRGPVRPDPYLAQSRLEETWLEAQA